MTVAPIGNGMYLVLTADTKPTTGVITGAVCINTQTGVISYYNGSVWTDTAGGGGSGEANLAANVGTGAGTIFRDKTSVTLNLKTIKAGSGVVITNNTNDITLDATGAGGGEVNTYSTVGTGAAWTLTKSGVNLPFRSIIMGSSKLSMTTNTNDLTIDVAQANLAIAYSQLTSVPTNIAKTDTTQTITGLNTFDQRLIIKALASTPADPASGYTALYAKTKDVSNEGIFAKIKVAGAVSEVELGVADEVLALNELSDVTITTPADKHFLVYSSGSSLFVNRLLATADLPTINATTNTVTDTSTANGDLLVSNGTKFVRMARGTSNQVLRTNTAGTGLEYATVSAGGGGDVYLANANTFTNVQKINVDNGTQMTFYRPVNTGGFGAGFSYDFNNSSGTEVNYGQQYVSLESNTAGAHRGDFNVQLAVAASLGIRFRVYTAGNGGLIFGNNGRIQVDESGLTAARVYTLPDATLQLDGISNTATLTNKTVNTTDNTITATSQATGDILKNNGTKFVRMARGTGLQVLRTNSGATDLEFASLDSERAGKSTASGNGSTTVFTIAHGLGATPGYAFVDCSSHAIARTWTVDGTNITVTFASAPSSGTNNVIIYWRVVA